MVIGADLISPSGFPFLAFCFGALIFLGFGGIESGGGRGGEEIRVGAREMDFFGLEKGKGGRNFCLRWGYLHLVVLFEKEFVGNA